MEIVKSGILKTCFEYDVFISYTVHNPLKYRVIVELEGQKQTINIYRSHGRKLTESENEEIREYITSQFKIQ